MDLGTQLSGSQSAKCVRRVHGYVNSVGFGVDGFGVATGRMTVHPPVSMSPIRFDAGCQIDQLAHPTERMGICQAVSKRMIPLCFRDSTAEVWGSGTTNIFACWRVLVCIFVRKL